MKHVRKVCAVLLAALMVAVILPATGLLAPAIDAADVGMIENGGFETGSGTGWTVYQWGVSFENKSASRNSGTYGCRLSKDQSHNGATFLTQVVPVNKNATYTFSFYGKSGKFDCSNYQSAFTYSLDLGSAAGKFESVVVNQAAPAGNTSGSWTKTTYTVNTGNYTYLRVRFMGTGHHGNEDSYLDDVALTVVDAGDGNTHAQPTLTGFGTDKNRPISASHNVVKQPGFESTDGAQWNTAAFVKTYVSVVEDAAKAHSGNKVLYYNNPGTVQSWHEFTVAVPQAGTYVLSAWVKTPYLSSVNQGKASLGIIDPTTDKFLMSGNATYAGFTSTPTQQIRSTAPDDEWHLRSVTFYVGVACDVRIGMYGKQSQMYVDDISVHLLSNGTPYVGEQQTATISPANNTSNLYCEAEDNLIADCNMTGSVAEEFWTHAASGWNNGFLSFDTAEGSHDRVLKFAGTSPASNRTYNYVKWIYVEPNTPYTVSFDYKVESAGSGALKFIDNNVALPAVFKSIGFSAATDWTTASFTFNPGVYNRIGILVTDGTGTVLFDDFRIFKTSAGIAVEPGEQVFPALKPVHPGQGVSRMEITEGLLGLAFKFELDARGAVRNERCEGDYTNATIDAFDNGDAYRLIAAGAIATNDAAVGQDPVLFVRESVNGSDDKVIDIHAKYWLKDPVDPETGEDRGLITYGVRIVNIPEEHKNTVIYVRPYYIFEYKDQQITVYGDVQYESFEPMKDINDGWLEWE
ncbi:MAG: carbohydrate binding domain-containing protein [Clostridia bacterium]|nr:carbohydrate binding domain-containing protein [Clostridia bacterium]